MKQVLIMTFEDSEGKPFTLRVNDPKEGLTEDEVGQAMNTIMSSNAFPKEGTLQRVVSAELVSTEVETLFDHGA